jgi:class 3 adenylate cyclase/tetratricopeptide (TPR) repeat protein
MTDPALTEVFASYVPRLIKKRVIANPTPIDTPLSENFEAVVLFADISGFTMLAERLAQRGPSGVETLAGILNEYFGQLIDIVHEYGGDVVKFAGDAVIAIWLIEAGTGDEIIQADRQAWTLHVAECALKIRGQLLNYKVEETTLYLKLALSTGRVGEVHVGGVFNRWEFLMTGGPFGELSIANGLAKPGDILLAPSAWGLIPEDCQAAPLEFQFNDKLMQAARLKSLLQSSTLSISHENLSISDAAENAMRVYIPGTIVSRLSAGHSGWIAELRRVSILFITLPDIDQDTPLETSQAITRLLQRAVYRYEGSINKINVDDKGVTVLAVLGMPPYSHEDDPVRAVQTALMIRKELADLKVRSSIGVTTGRIFCGSIGNDSRREYTIIGNAVNLSARLMAAASQQVDLIEKMNIPILCDRPTYDSAREAVEFEVRPAQRVKGRTEAVEMFHPLEEKRNIVRATTELIGRQEEKVLLANALQELARGAPFNAVILHGEAGIGKSRLMEELLHQAELSHIKTFVGEGDAIEKNTPYFAWRPVFNRVLGIEGVVNKPQLAEEDRAAIRDAAINKLSEIAPDLLRLTPLLTVILPISIPENEFTASMTGEVRGGNIRDLLVRLLQHEAESSPILVALEDLHWLDSASWTLLADVYQKVRPMLLAVDTRPLSQPVPTQFKELAERSETKFLKLDMMPLDDVEALVCQRLGVKSVPREVGKLIREKSEGHPFFAEELAYALRDSGVLVIENQECHIAQGIDDLAAVTLPDTLQAAITSRIDGLNPSQQLTLKVASVIGRIFAYRTLEGVHPIAADKPELHAYLDALTRLSLTMVEAETPDLAYIFKHAVTQEVAYNLMLYAQRRQLHRAVAEWIEQSHQEDIESFYTLLAYHWTQAAQMPDAATLELVTNKAIDYLEKAGDQSLNNFANAEAVEFFSQVLQLADMSKVSKLRLGGWYRKIGEAYLGLGKLVEAKEYIVKAMATFGLPLPGSNLSLTASVLGQVVRQTGHRLWPERVRANGISPEEEKIRLEQVILTEKLAIVQFLNGDPNPLPMLFGVLAGLNVAETMEVTPELWAMYATMSAVAGFIPLASQAKHYKDRWFELGEQIDDPNLFVDGASALCTVASGNGAWQEVRDLVAKSSAICEELGDHRRGAEAVAYVAVNALMEGGPKLAEPYNQREWEIAMRRENPIHIAFAYQVDCTGQAWRGDYETCIANAQKCLALSEKSWVGDIPEYIVRGAMWLAMWHKGEREEAWNGVKAALDKFAKASVVDFSAHLIDSHLAEVAFLALEQGKKDDLPKAQMDEIEKYAKMALKNLKKFTAIFPIGGPSLNRFSGHLASYQNKPEKALQYWRTGTEKAHVFPMKYEEGRSYLELARHLPKESPERAAAFEKASGLFDECGLENWAAIVRDEISN